MHEQNKETRGGGLLRRSTKQNREARSPIGLWSEVWISVIMLGILITLSGCKKQPSEPTQTEQQVDNSFKPAKTKAEIINTEKASLEDITSATRTWIPVYKSWYGKPAPDFLLVDTNGRQHALSDYHGKTVLIIFWAMWCPPCRVEIPHLIELRQTTSEDNLAMLAITKEYPTLVKKFVIKQKINYTVLFDNGRLPMPYSLVNAIPSSFFIDPDGRIKLAAAGLMSLEEIKAILRAK